MKKQLLFLLLCVTISFIGQAQTPSIKFTSIPASTEVGTILKVNYEYTAADVGQIYCGISLLDDVTYVSFVNGKGLNPAPAGTNVTGSLEFLIPGATVPTANLTGLQNYKIKIELKDASNNFLAGDFPTDNYIFTPATSIIPAISFTSVPTSTAVGTDLTVNYKYSAPNPGIIKFSVTKNGGANPWTYISSVAYAELNPTATGTNLTGSFTVPIPADTTVKTSLTGNQNYRIKIEMYNSSNVWLVGNYDNINYNFTANLSTNDFDELSKISIYPNPVANTLKLNSVDAASDAAFNVVDISGKTIIKSKSLNNNSIDVSSLRTGVYILSVEKDQKVKQFKFIKQ